jgi:hypothetical protein
MKKEFLVGAALIGTALSESVTQYLALTPETGIVSWQKATFPANYTATSADDVTIEDIDETIDQIGSWQNLNIEGTPLLTIKTYGDNLYAQLNTYVAPLGPTSDGYYQGGCCADSFRSFNKNQQVGEEYQSFDIMNTIFDVFENATDTDKFTGTPFAYANHVFDMADINDSIIAMLAITYHEPALDYSEVEAVLFYDTTTSSVMKTKDGDAFFSFYQKIGTLSTETNDGIYNIMYTMGGPEQYHMNGITRFQAKDGTWILAVTFRANAECVLLKCPFTYTSSDGGGTILQRFGTPSGHRFGYSASDGEITAMHNMYHTIYPDDINNGKETLTLFVNSQVGYSNSRIFEFEVKLTPEPDTSYDDTIFDTTYISGTTDFYTGMWGGGRPIGQGVWFVGFNQISVIDQTSNPESLNEENGNKLTIEDIEINKKNFNQLQEQLLLKNTEIKNHQHKVSLQNEKERGVDENSNNDDDLNIPWDDDAFTIYDIYDPFTFLNANE